MPDRKLITRSLVQHVALQVLLHRYLQPRAAVLSPREVCQWCMPLWPALELAFQASFKVSSRYKGRIRDELVTVRDFKQIPGSQVSHRRDMHSRGMHSKHSCAPGVLDPNLHAPEIPAACPAEVRCTIITETRA